MNDTTTPAAVVEASAAPAEPATLADIERRAKQMAEAREALSGLMGDLNAAIQAIQRERMPAIRRAINRATAHHAALQALIESNPGLFKKPRTTIFHGIKLGMQKSKDTLSYDAEMVLKQIKLRLPLKQDALIRTKEELVMEAVKLLTLEEKAKIGVRNVPGTDSVLIAPTDSAIDKAVNALLKAAIDEKTSEAEGA